MILDFQGLPLGVNDVVVFLDVTTVTLRRGTVTSLGGEYISVLADSLWVKFRVLPRDVVRVNSLSLPNS
jgi:hypothetical protein